MRKLLLASLLSASAFAVPAQAFQLGVTEEHQPNEHTLACLAAPTKECAVSAALQTVINEQLPLERAKVLVGIGTALIEQGDYERARRTLDMSIDEARISRLGLILQERLKVVAPLIMRLGDAPTALALAQEIQIPSLQDQTLLKIADEAALRGEMGTVRTALSQLSNNERAFWALLNLHVQTKGQELTALENASIEERVYEIGRPDRKYRGLISLAILNELAGNEERAARLRYEADLAFAAIDSLGLKAEASSVYLDLIVRAGYDGEKLDEAYAFANRQAESVRSGFAKKTNSMLLGKLESQLGYSEAALAHLNVFETAEEKSGYLRRLVTLKSDAEIDSLVEEVLSDIATIDGAYDRDQLRLMVLEGVIASGNKNMALAIVADLEDDDNQALGLSLSAPLL